MTLWTVAHQALLPMGFSRQEYWSGLLCPPSGDLPNPRMEPAASLMSPALVAGFFTISTNLGCLGFCGLLWSKCVPSTSSCIEILTFKDEAPFRWGLWQMLKSLVPSKEAPEKSLAPSTL